jgi:riboflavin synthase
MFTGLIKTQGTIRRVDQRGDCMMTIALAETFPIEIGDSIAINGICLTATKVNDNEFRVSLSAETMTRTTAKDWIVGTVVNIEPSLNVGDAMGGHFVSGHVDGLAHSTSAEKSGDSTIWEFEVPPHLSRFIAAKGSVTLDGVSLTVNEVRDAQNPSPLTRFTVNIIPHTAKVTSFGRLKVGENVNLEIDMLARYVARLTGTK